MSKKIQYGEMMIDSASIAKICHQANKAYCEAIGDNTQLDWEDAPEWQRTSAINGVNFHLGGARSPGDSHKNWMDEKLSQGWKYGVTKDEEKKTHPCLVPFNKLPLGQQAKDYIFTNIVRAFKGEVGPRIEMSNQELAALVARLEGGKSEAKKGDIQTIIKILKKIDADRA